MNALCKLGLHLHCVDGEGMFGDGIFCLDCGQDKYPEVFNGFPIIVGNLENTYWAERVRKKRSTLSS